MNNQSCCQKKIPFWLGFILGGLFGAATIFLLGTKEGKKLAKKLLEKTEVFEEELEEKISKLEDSGQDFLKEAQAVKDRIVNDIDKEKKQISTVLASKMNQTLGKIEDIQKKGVELTKEVRHRYFKKNGKTLTS